MVKYVCPSCNRSGRVVYANGASAAVCSLCGTIVPSDLLSKLTQDTSGALSNVDGFVAEGASFGLDGDEDREAEYELDGLRGRRDDQAEGGRTYLGSGGNIFSENGGTRMQGTNVRKLEGRVEYQRREKTELRRYVRSMCDHIGSKELTDRAMLLFMDAKDTRDLTWGRQSIIMATACIYVAAKERQKPITILQLAAFADIDFRVLVRAQNTIKTAVKIKAPSLDPLLFIEPQIVHFKNLLASSPRPPLTGGKKPDWSPANLEWLRSLSLEAVRELAIGLLAFTTDLQLLVGRAAEQIACVIVLVAMEGVARRRPYAVHEIMSELCALLEIKAFTVSERYREVNKALADYAPRIPWIAGAFKTKKKMELMGFTEDIVKFWKGLNLIAVKAADAGKSQNKLVMLQLEDEEGRVIAESEVVEEDEQEDLFPDPLRSKAATPVIASTSTSKSSQLGPASRTIPVASALSPFLASTSEAAASLLVLGGTETPLSTPASRKLSDLVNKPYGSVRPEEYMRKPRPGPQRRQETLDRAATSLLSPFADASPGSGPSPLASAPAPAQSAFALVSTQAPRTSAYTAHSQETVNYRQRLLAGHDVVDIYRGVAAPVREAPSRLDQILWSKNAEDVEDDELFGLGELDSFFRTAGEVEAFKDTGKFWGCDEFTPDIELSETGLVEHKKAQVKPTRKAKRERNSSTTTSLEGTTKRVKSKRSKLDSAMQAKISLLSGVDQVTQTKLDELSGMEGLVQEYGEDSDAAEDEVDSDIAGPSRKRRASSKKAKEIWETETVEDEEQYRSD